MDDTLEWITWRMPNGAKHYGKVCRSDATELFSGGCPIPRRLRVFWPMYMETVEQRGVKPEDTRVTTRVQVILFGAEYDENCEWFNPATFASWQRVTNKAYAEALDKIAAGWTPQGANEAVVDKDGASGGEMG